MQIRHIEYFVSLAQLQHFARAADACGVAQPTLSAGVAALEAALGKRLVLRDRRFVGLTLDGAAVLPWAQQLLADYAALRTAADGETGEALAGVVRVGAIPASMPSLGPLVRVLTLRHPALSVEIGAMTSRQIDKALTAFEIDGGVTYLESEAPARVVSTPLYEQRYLFATRRREGEAEAGGCVTWAEAVAGPLCLLTPDMQYRRMLDQRLTQLGLRTQPRVVANSYVALLSMVHAGGFSCILPHVYADLVGRDPDIVLRELCDSSPTHPVGVVTTDREPASPFARALHAAAASADLKTQLQALFASSP